MNLINKSRQMLTKQKPTNQMSTKNFSLIQVTSRINFYKALLLILLATGLTACGGGGGGGGSPPLLKGTEALSISNFLAFPSAEGVRLTWTNPSAEIASFNLTVRDFKSQAIISSASNSALISSINRSSNADAEYTVANLTADSSYSFTLSANLMDDRSTPPVNLSRSHNGEVNINRILLGPNNDNDEYIDSEDPDDDNDNTADAVDVDLDGDGLIEIHNVTAFNAIRYNLNGGGLDLADDGNNQTGGDARGCPTTDCVGYELVTNIDLAPAYTNWQPIGRCNGGDCSNAALTFSGIFDGNGYSISNLFINTATSNQGVGLFGVTSGAELRNLRLTNVNISISVTDFSNTGSMVGNMQGGSLTNISASGPMISNAGSIGGLVGFLNGGQIVHSLAVFSSLTTGPSTIGGLVGGIAQAGVVSSSVAIIDTISSNGRSAGGLVGSVSGNSVIQASTSIVNTITVPFTLGGLVAGIGDSGGQIFSAKAVAYSNVASGFDAENIGGLLGDVQSGQATYSLALTNSITGTNLVGGLIGSVGSSASAESFATSYWDLTIATVTATGGSVTIDFPGSTTTALQSPTTFAAGGIYENWAGATAGWCNPHTGDYSNAAEAPDGYLNVWNLGTATEYPALNCLPISLEQQRNAEARVLRGESPLPLDPPL